MGVFGIVFGCRGDGGFNDRCSGASIGDGGFTLVCSGGRRGDGGFMLAYISGRRGVIGFNVATSQQPVREIVRPAHKKWPKIGVLWRAGRSFSRNRLCWPSSVAPPLRHTCCWATFVSGRIGKRPAGTPQTDGHEKSTPEGVLVRNAEPPPVDRTEGGRCAPEGTRTPNLLNRNQMLYPLSYGRLPFGWV